MSNELSWDTAPTGETLWGVFGAECFPTVFACRLRDYFWHGRAIWGFSNHEGVPGFRTLGVDKAWAVKNGLRLFATREDAFAHISSLFPAQQAEASPTPQEHHMTNSVTTNWIDHDRPARALQAQQETSEDE